MIIKSMSRKKASFSQLVDYMNKELSSPQRVGHNLYMGERTTQAEIINEFEKNAEHLPQRKNGNYLYHEVISFEKNDLDQGRMDEIIIELAELYLSERAPKQLAYAVIHRDTEKPHIHFCISANELGGEKRKRLSKQKFLNLQKNLERYALEKFPELNNKLVYTKERDPEKSKTTNREQELKRRTLKMSTKDILKNRLHGLFELSNTKKELDEHLEKEGYAIYTRGKNAGIEKTDSKKKYRFTTLGVMEHYLGALERFDSLEKNKRERLLSKQQEAEQYRANEEAEKRAEQQRQAQLLAEQEKAAEETRRMAEQQKQADLLAEQEKADAKAQREAEQQQKLAQEKQQQEQQKAAQAKRPSQQQREEYVNEKEAEEKRKEAFLSRGTGKKPRQENQKEKPTKTRRRQRTEQVRVAEEKARPVSHTRSPEPEKPRVSVVEPVREKKPVKQDRNKATIKPKPRKQDKSKMFTPKTQDETFENSKQKIKKGRSDNERDYLAAQEKEKIMQGAPNTKEQDQIRDRLGELNNIFKGKNKDKDRER